VSTAILDGLRAFRHLVAAAAIEVFQPLPRVTVSKWADDNRILPSYSPAPGRFRTSRLPYMKRIQDVLGDESINEVVFAKSSQIAGSTIGENFCGYLMDQAPCAILMVWPTEEKLKKWSLKRLDPMLEETPCLAAKFKRSGRRDPGDSIAYKEFPGGWLNAITARSTTALKSDTARVAICEEPDEWEGDLNDQGDPLDLLLVRIRNFWNRKLYINGTPTVAGFSRIWKLLEQTTWEEFWVPCPHCQEGQVLKWRDEDDEGNETGDYRFVFERDDHGEVIAGSTKYVCAHCGCEIEEQHKEWMLAEGAKRFGIDGWVPRFPGRRAVGFHCWTAYSVLSSWDEIARAFLKAKDTEIGLKSFVNTWLGRPFRAKTDSISAHFLSQRAIEYPVGGPDGTESLVPRGVGLLSCGVDVQRSWLDLSVWGWGALERAWVLSWIQIHGDPELDQVWRELDEILMRPWLHEDGATMRVAVTCIDAGYNTERIWRFCAGRSRFNVIATVGRDGRGRKLIEAPDPARLKKVRSKKRPMHIVGVDSGKDMLAARLRITDPAAAKYIHFNTKLDPVFYDQLTAEELTTVAPKNGRPTRKWVLPSDRRNETLDEAILNMAGLAYLGMPVINQLGVMAERISEQGRAIAAGRPIQRPPSAAPIRRVISKGVE
jgi:phage terminase large subunit GpA-like protein